MASPPHRVSHKHSPLHPLSLRHKPQAQLLQQLHQFHSRMRPNLTWRSPT